MGAPAEALELPPVFERMLDEMAELALARREIDEREAELESRFNDFLSLEPPPDDDRRLHLRVPCAMQVVMHFGNHDCTGRVQNLSYDGAFVELSGEFKVGERVTVDLPTRPGVGQLQLKGSVAWKSGPNSGGSVGIVFDPMRPNRAHALRKVLLDLLREHAASPD